jgi:hypothetical protein
VGSAAKVSRNAAISGKLIRGARLGWAIWEQQMPIDLSAVNWTYVALMAGFAFVSALLGGLISFRNRLGGAIIAAILFAAMYVAWNYYPHPQFQLPIVTTYSYPG